MACDYLYVQSTVRAWSINDLLYGKRTPFSCGTKPVIPSGHIINGSTLIAGSHHLTRAGVFGSILSLLKVLEDVARLQTVLITVVLWWHSRNYGLKLQQNFLMSGSVFSSSVFNSVPRGATVHLTCWSHDYSHACHTTITFFIFVTSIQRWLMGTVG